MTFIQILIIAILGLFSVQKSTAGPEEWAECERILGGGGMSPEEVAEQAAVSRVRELLFQRDEAPEPVPQAKGPMQQVASEVKGEVPTLYDIYKWLENNSYDGFLSEALEVTSATIRNWKRAKKIPDRKSKTKARLVTLYKAWNGMATQAELKADFDKKMLVAVNGHVYLRGSSGIIFTTWFKKLRDHKGQKPPAALKYLNKFVPAGSKKFNLGDIAYKAPQSVNPALIEAVERAYDTAYPLKDLLPKRLVESYGDKDLIDLWYQVNFDEYEVDIFTFVEEANEYGFPLALDQLSYGLVAFDENATSSFEELVYLYGYFKAAGFYKTVDKVSNSTGGTDVKAVSAE